MPDLAENAHRRVVNPMELARKFVEAQGKGHEPKAIAVHAKLNPQTVGRYIRLCNKGIPDLHRAVEKDLIEVNAAIEISSLKPEEQEEALAEALRANAAAGGGKKGRRAASRAAREEDGGDEGVEGSSEVSDKPTKKEISEFVAQINAGNAANPTEASMTAVQVCNWFESKRRGEHVRALLAKGRDALKEVEKAEAEKIAKLQAEAEAKSKAAQKAAEDAAAEAKRARAEAKAAASAAK
jgi:hypothetical protein